MDWHSVKDGGQKIHLRWIEYIEFLTKALGKHPYKKCLLTGKLVLLFGP